MVSMETNVRCSDDEAMLHPSDLKSCAQKEWSLAENALLVQERMASGRKSQAVTLPNSVRQHSCSQHVNNVQNALQPCPGFFCAHSGS